MKTREILTVSGQVQGVGFRPFVWRLARAEGLTGFVRNTSEGVRIEVQGPEDSLRRFDERLRSELPPLARILGIERRGARPDAGEKEFRILESSGQASHSVLVSPDVSVCADCLREMRDENDFRHNYPFINCTNCGPRYTITRSIPYDRASTTMACFGLCPVCSAEYSDPADRRFHAQPIACPACGPRIWYVPAGADHTGLCPENEEQALERACALLAEGGILALKGLGGFQLACDAASDEAVRKLRLRKARPHKPLAVMAADIGAADGLCALSQAHRELLASPARPIVLCPKRGHSALSRLIAPDAGKTGLLLPNTPLHALLLERMAQKGVRALVMTSGNPPGEPICLGNREALGRLAGLADGWLLHNRDILARVDDSVFDLHAARPVPVRRARGYVPGELALPGRPSGAVVLGAGAELKAAFCFARGAAAVPGPHIGDMRGAAALDFYREALKRMEELLRLRPDAIVADLHPDFLSTRLAEEIGRELGIPVFRLQHHAAHAASVLAENGEGGEALALCLDGTGLGPDGTVWGGELLWLDLRAPEWRRLGCLGSFALPGGDRAAEEPWRIARSLQLACGLADCPGLSVAKREIEIIDEMLARPSLTVSCTSCGRLFDAVSAQLGLCTRTSYEGQAAVRLENAAARFSGERPYECAVESKNGLWRIDSAALFSLAAVDMLRGRPAGAIAASFQSGLADGLARMAAGAARETGCRKIGLSGGCLQNESFAGRLCASLAAAGLEPLVHGLVPPGDGGLSLGQAFFGQRLLDAS